MVVVPLEPDQDFDIKTFLRNLTTKSGVYCYFDAGNTLIYVGKAKNLKRRVSSYFQKTQHDAKTEQLVSHIHRIEVTVTHTEAEALLLENNLIKQHRPKYNIVFRDDKSYPFVMMTDHAFPQIRVHRGAKRGKADYFGPYPNVHAVRSSLVLLQKIFKLRSCDDSFFTNRTRPCLQYQIKRCSAPCVGYISAEDYTQSLEEARLFLRGQREAVLERLANQMEAASQKQAYEQAAELRDQIALLQKIQAHYLLQNAEGEVDVLGFYREVDHCCIQRLMIRSGQLLGSKAFYFKGAAFLSDEAILSSFITQYYAEHLNEEDRLKTILVSAPIEEKTWLEDLLSELAKRKVTLHDAVRGKRAQWVNMARVNAENSLKSRLAVKESYLVRFESLQERLGLEEMPERLECFDISHTRGEAPVASCVVFNLEGPLKRDYRRFNIENITGGDDYAAMEQALRRRYARLKRGEAPLPDILFIDGGKGQVSRARLVLESLQLQDVLTIGVSKGTGRRPGLETLLIGNTGASMRLDAESPALHLIQQIRDEAHRFAISSHQKRREGARTQSRLEEIPGVGATRRRALLRRFGSVDAVRESTVEELKKVNGISAALAQQILDDLRG